MASPPPAGEETLVQHLIRSTKNCFVSCVGGIQKSDELARIKYKELEIRSRKQKFGVEYVDLVEKGASEEELKKCLETCLKSIEGTTNEIKELQKEVERVDAETKSKVIAKPGASNATAPPVSAPEPASSDTVTPATSTPTAPTPAPAPAPETETPVEKVPAPAPETETPASSTPPSS